MASGDAQLDFDLATVDRLVSELYLSDSGISSPADSVVMSTSETILAHLVDATDDDEVDTDWIDQRLMKASSTTEQYLRASIAYGLAVSGETDAASVLSEKLMSPEHKAFVILGSALRHSNLGDSTEAWDAVSLAYELEPSLATMFPQQIDAIFRPDPSLDQ